MSTGLSIVQALHADACIYLNGALIDFDPSQSDYASLTGHKPSSPGSLVNTGLSIVQALHADACIYLNGALIDFDPSQSDYASLTGHKPSSPGSLVKNGFDSQRACEVFDVTRYWTTQTWQFSDLRDVTHGIEYKIIIFPRAEQTNLLHELIPDDFAVHVSEGRLWMLMAPHANKKDAVQTLCDLRDVTHGIEYKIIIFPRAEQTNLLHELIPDDFAVHVSEGRLWMLMAPHANKKDAVQTLCDQWGMDVQQATAFGDDMVDIGMMNLSGTGVAVAHANPAVLSIADVVCPSNDVDGVALWLEQAHGMFNAWYTRHYCCCTEHRRGER